MDHNKIRAKFLNFFKSKDHVIVESSDLVDKSDPSVLLTTAGMQQFKSYYSGDADPEVDFNSRRVASVQKCFRTSDIEEVGDKDHLTFLEMLGNFSFGDYYKKGAMEFAWEFLTEELEISEEKLWVTVFAGEDNIPKDKKAHQIANDLGVPDERIAEAGRKDNFWGPTGAEGPCGPTAEIHYDLTGEPCGDNCGPNCEKCNRFVEVWNLVFNQYYQDKEGNLESLDEKGIDTGLGFERLCMVLQGVQTVFKTDLFSPALEKLSEYGLTNEDRKDQRIVADHIKGACFLASEGLIPSNLKEGYVLRRVIRRAIEKANLYDLKNGWLEDLVDIYAEIYTEAYPELGEKKEKIVEILKEEANTFAKALERGKKKFYEESENLPDDQNVFPGDVAFDLYQSYGLPKDYTEVLAKESGYEEGIQAAEFEKAKEVHIQNSKSNQSSKKKGGLRGEATEREIALHTATHLLQAALRQVLGEQVIQKGSDIKPERLRFDFSWPEALTEEEIERVEGLVNKKIKADLEIEKKEVSLENAIEEGALAPFKDRYPDKVSIYTIKDPDSEDGYFSKEVCLGPHLSRTGRVGEFGQFKITKEASSSAGVRRIKAVLTSDS